MYSEQLATEFLSARTSVPHRPHLSAPQTGGLGQKLLGLLAKPVDVAKDATRSFVEVRYHHPANTTTGRPIRVDPSLLA